MHCALARETSLPALVYLRVLTSIGSTRASLHLRMVEGISFVEAHEHWIRPTMGLMQRGRITVCDRTAGGDLHQIWMVNVECSNSHRDRFRSFPGNSRVNVSPYMTIMIWRPWGRTNVSVSPSSYTDMGAAVVMPHIDLTTSSSCSTNTSPHRNMQPCPRTKGVQNPHQNRKLSLQ